MKEEVKEVYEVYIGNVIVEIFKERKLELNEVFGVFVYGYGLFIWGCLFIEVVENSLILDEICLMVKENKLINLNICEIL